MRPRISANPHANGGLLLRDLRLPDFRDKEYAVDVPKPGAVQAQDTRSPSTSFGPVHPFGVRRTIIGQNGLVVLLSSRAAFWIA